MIALTSVSELGDAVSEGLTLHKFEIAMLGNLCPASYEEAVALISR